MNKNLNYNPTTKMKNKLPPVKQAKNTPFHETPWTTNQSDQSNTDGEATPQQQEQPKPVTPVSVKTDDHTKELYELLAFVFVVGGTFAARFLL